MSDTHNGDGIAQPCANPNCNFCGHAGFDNYCSVCYKQQLNNSVKQEGEKIDVDSRSEINKDKIASESLKSKAANDESLEERKTENSTDISDVKDAKTCEDDKDTKRVQKNRKRCFDCRKKVGLTGFECRCGYVYCGLHRMPEDHMCTFDHSSYEREHLKARAQKIEPHKVDRL